nr:ABC transporter permease [Schaalia cardiffensis]
MLSLMKLPGRNLRAYGARSAFLFAFAVLMAVATFGGSVLIHGIHRGLDTVEARLGADIVVTPSDAANEFNPQSFLIEAEPGYFYMDKSTVQKVGAIDGVKAVSGQIFLASARSSCCSGRYQVVAFDPSTDFVVQPWIADSVGGVDIGLMDVIVGANVAVPPEGSFRIYGENLRVVGQFDPTGSTLDNAVYTNFDTAKVLLQASVDKELNKYPDLDPDAVVSSVMVAVEPGADIETVAEQIRAQVEGVNVATAKNMVKGIATALDRVSSTISIFIGLVWLLGAGMTVLVFTMMLHERAQEFALLKALGASRSQLGRLVVHEALLIDLVGGLAGIVLAGGVLAAFRTLVTQLIGIGFVLPSPPQMGLLAVESLAAVLLAAVLASWVSMMRVNRMDAALVLKEGE